MNIKKFPEFLELRNYQIFYEKVSEIYKNSEMRCRHNKYLVLTGEGLDKSDPFDLERVTKIFKIPESISFLLNNTEHKITKQTLLDLKPPFPTIFLDMDIVVFDKKYYGILVYDENPSLEWGVADGWYNEDGTGIAKGKTEIEIKEIIERLQKEQDERDDLYNHKHSKISREYLEEDYDPTADISVATVYEEEGELKLSEFDLRQIPNNKYEKKITEYITNFFSFVNSEEVKLMFVEKTKSNQLRRMVAGKVALPSYNKLYVGGYLKKYVDEIEIKKQGKSFSHRFWVRGHFRHFWHKKYYKLYKLFEEGKLKRKDRQYIMQNGTLKLWILPHLKGEGILINKTYELK